MAELFYFQNYKTLDPPGWTMATIQIRWFVGYNFFYYLITQQFLKLQELWDDDETHDTSDDSEEVFIDKFI